MSIEAPLLRRVEVAGTPFEIGARLGAFGREIAHRHLVRSPAWHSVLAFRNDSRVGEMRRLVAERLPWCWQELQGLAEGLALPFDEVFLWNCRGDVWAMAPDGCTTVMIPGDEPLLAHNEDGDPGFRGHCALAVVRPESGPGFAAFVYPASLPGHAFAVTQSGLVQTVNNIRSLGAGPGLPRMVVGRAVLACASLDEALRLIEAAPRAGAFHFALAQRGDERLFSVEFSHDRVSVQRIRSPACHANHFVHANQAGSAQRVTDSSAARQRRGDELVAGAADPLTILWDRSDPLLPVAREDPADPDGENTLATAVIRIGRDAVHWQVHDRPGADPAFHGVDARIGEEPLV
jgi:hypothetical protein